MRSIFKNVYEILLGSEQIIKEGLLYEENPDNEDKYNRDKEDVILKKRGECMSLQLVLGGSGKGKTWFLQHYITREAAMYPERQYIMVVPEQFTMQTQKELIEISEQKGIMNVDVQSFLRLAFRVFSETGSNNIPVLDDMGKTMILKKVLHGMQDELQYFGKTVRKKGYIQEIKSFLSELFQYGVDLKQLNEMIDCAVKQPVLKKKLEDIRLIYQRFLEYLENNYITSEEILTVFSKVAADSAILKDSIVCFDGFTGFTPTQYQILEQLLLCCKKVYVTVTIDHRESIVKMGPKHALFYMSQKTICHLRQIAKERSVEVCPEIWTGESVEETRYANVPGIAFLEQNLFRYSFEKYNGIPEDISIHILKQPEKEVTFLLSEIKKLLKEENCRYRDIAVVTGNIELYGMLAKEAFGQADIPCFIDQKKSVLANPFVAMIMSIFDVLLSNLQQDSVLKFVKNPFFNGTEEQKNLLDNFLCATGIRGLKKWKEVWDYKSVFKHSTREMQEYYARELDTIRLETVEQIEPLYESMAKGEHTVREYAQAICTYLEEQRFYVKLMELSEQFERDNLRELAGEYRQVYGITLDVMDRLVELLGEEKMPLKEFKEILDIGFSEARIGLIPPGVDQVVIGDINRTRLQNIKYVFFLGANDCNMANSRGGGVISETERNYLTEQEFELAPTSREQIYTQQFYLYLSMTKPSCHLYMTYCEAGNDGTPQNPAYIVERVEKLFPDMHPVIEEKREDNIYYLGNDLGITYLIEGLRRADYSKAQWKEIYRFYKEKESGQQLLDKLLHAAFYCEQESKLSKEAVHELYHDILTGSTSQFEHYAACAFSYFMRYGLRLRERQEHQVAFFDIGNIVHGALELYTQKLLEENKQWQDITEEEQHIRANQCINEVVENYRNGLLYSTERDTYMINRLRRLLIRTVWAITKQMDSGSFQTVKSEFSFEILNSVKGSKIREIFDGEEEGMLRLIGRIDRLDSCEMENAQGLKIIDYKTGKKAISLSDLYYGLQMQLMIYLKAGVDSQSSKTKKLIIPAGVLYYQIDDPMIEGKDTPESIENQILSALKANGYVNEDEQILVSYDKSFDTDANGLPPNMESQVAPFATNKSGGLKKTSKTLTTDDFIQLMEFTEKKLGLIHQEIMSGKIQVNPYRRMDSTKESACDWCPYHGICRFDSRIHGNAYHSIKKLTEDEVLSKIKQEKEEETADEQTGMDQTTTAGN